MPSKGTALRVAIAAVIVSSGGMAQAAMVNCDVDAPNNKNYMQVPDTQVAACLDAGVGNIGDGPNDDFLNGVGSAYSEIADTGDDSKYSLTWGAGTWSFDASAWADYSNLALGFKFGTGNTPDEWFVYSLLPNVTSGTWSFIDILAPGTSDDRLSHIVLYGTGGSTQVPEPGPLALLGLGLMGLGVARRRRA